MQKKQKKKIQLIEKPYLKGAPRDAMTLKRALSVLGTVVVSMFIYLIVGSVMISDSFALRLLISAVFVLMFAALAYSNGMNAGFQDVTFAEIAYQRRESGKPVDAADEKKCFHSLKGLVSALIGIVPIFLLAVILAVTTQPQYFIRSALPSWIAALERRTEIGNALQFYHQGGALGVLDIIRVIVRLAIMPFATLVGGDNITAITLVERLSPLLVLIVPLGYALGYRMGPRARARVHAGIAANERKKRKRDKKRVQQKRKGPEQLV